MFETEKARETFRQRIYKLKKGQDKAVTDILDEEKVVLRSERSSISLGEDANHAERYLLKLWTEDKKPPTYAILSIEEVDDPERR